MINYYKFKVSYYKINMDNKYFVQINDAVDATSFGVITNESAFNSINNAIEKNMGDQWEVISEEDFTVVKEKVLSKLNK